MLIKKKCDTCGHELHPKQKEFVAFCDRCKKMLTYDEYYYGCKTELYFEDNKELTVTRCKETWHKILCRNCSYKLEIWLHEGEKNEKQNQ